MCLVTRKIVGYQLQDAELVWSSLSYIFPLYSLPSPSYRDIGKCRLMTGNSTCDSLGAPYKVDFAGTDSIFTTANYAAYPDLQLYPIMAGQFKF